MWPLSSVLFGIDTCTVSVVSPGPSGIVTVTWPDSPAGSSAELIVSSSCSPAYSVRYFVSEILLTPAVKVLSSSSQRSG